MLRRLVTNLLKHRIYKFKQWIDLEDRKIVIAGASDKSREFSKLIYKFLSDALPIPSWIWEHVYWGDTLDAYIRVASALPLRTYLPIISLTPEKNDIKKPTWDYDGRNWYFYANLIAEQYGWTLKEISNLNSFTGMALVEEILLSRQLEREFQWSMSEASVIYDDRSKTTKPNPLPRPYWMKQSNPTGEIPIPRFKIDKSKMPIGAVNYDAISQEYQPKEIKSFRDGGAKPTVGG